MFFGLRSTLSFVLPWLLAVPSALTAQQNNSGAAPVPPQLLHAHTIFVANAGGSTYFDIFDGGPNRAYNTFYTELKRTKRYELVSSPSQADLTFEIRAIAPESSGVDDTPSYDPQVILTVREPKTNAVLWSESANVRAFGTKGRRDSQFDQSVAVLVDKLAQSTGQPLTDKQAKAIAANSKIPTAAKVFLISGIAGAVAMTAWGIHRINNPPKLNPPPTPTLP